MDRMSTPYLRGQFHMILGGLVAMIALTSLASRMFESPAESPGAQAYTSSGKTWPPQLSEGNTEEVGRHQIVASNRSGSMAIEAPRPSIARRSAESAAEGRSELGSKSTVRAEPFKRASSAVGKRGYLLVATE